MKIFVASLFLFTSSIAAAKLSTVEISGYVIAPLGKANCTYNAKKTVNGVESQFHGRSRPIPELILGDDGKYDFTRTNGPHIKSEFELMPKGGLELHIVVRSSMTVEIKPSDSMWEYIRGKGKTEIRRLGCQTERILTTHTMRTRRGLCITIHKDLDSNQVIKRSVFQREDSCQFEQPVDMQTLERAAAR